MTTHNVVAFNGVVPVRARLNVHSGAPSLSAPITMNLEIGSELPVRGITAGDAVNGNAQWYMGLNDTYFWAGACGPLNGPSPAPAPLGDWLAGRVESAPPDLRGIRRNRPVSGRDGRSLRDDGVSFCVRQLAQANGRRCAGDLSRAEAETILNAGLALMAVQPAEPGNPAAVAELGRDHGGEAACNALQAGLPPGVTIWLALEGVPGDVPRQALIDYCNAWFAAVGGAGYAAGVSVGERVALSSGDLYWSLKTQRYWRSDAGAPDVAYRGYQLVSQQGATEGRRATKEACCATQYDSFSNAALWLARA